MKHFWNLIFILFIFPVFLFGQIDNAKNLKETATEMMKAGEWDKAVIALNRAIVLDASNFELQKNLLQCLYYKRDFEKAVELIKTITEKPEADVMTFQLAANVYKALEEKKEAENIFRMGLKKFPKSGPLYSEFGELLWSNKELAAIEFWEKGIETDPTFSSNYYHAANFYLSTKDKVWTLIYGEIFVNMESLSNRGATMKATLLKCYKEQIFAEIDLFKEMENEKNLFAKTFLQNLSKQTAQLAKGETIETLTMIRTRFILDWFTSSAAKFPFRLFDYHQQLLKEGLFEAYNQWIFGAIDNLSAFENWTKIHAEEYNRFTSFMKNRIFKMQPGQYYKNK